jgi:uncharacterized Zn-finger protein
MKSRVALVLALAALSAGCRPTEKFNNNKTKRVVKWYSILLINMSTLSFQSIIYKYCSRRSNRLHLFNIPMKKETEIEEYKVTKKEST